MQHQYFDSSSLTEKMITDLQRLTFPNYEAASLRSIKVASTIVLVSDEEDSATDPDFNIYSAENVIPILAAAIGLSGILLSHYAIAPVALYVLFSPWLIEGPHIGATSLILPTVALVCIVNIIVSTFHRPVSHVSGRIGLNSVGATNSPGLYHMALGNMAKILRNCPILTAPTTITGSLPSLPSTPWIFTGDMRTIVPFLAFKPADVVYTRRWVRVSLSDGPLGDMKHQDSAFCTNEKEQCFEAVALDCSYAKKVPQNYNNEACDNLKAETGQEKIDLQIPGVIKNKDERRSNDDELKNNFVLLILAGLTGGSGEGYVLDLVNAANNKGVDCFVMLGRGLGGTPNLSEAAFHGARTSDVRETARVLKKSLPKETKIFVVGISMGGIIVTNAVGRSVLTGLVDGAVSVCGCFDTAKNINFTHSRTYWQPLLNLGLKQAFVSPKGALKKMARRMGPLANEIITKTKDIIAFDSCVVTALHGFRDVYHYYSDQRLMSMISSSSHDKSEEIRTEDLVPLICLEKVLIDSEAARASERDIFEICKVPNPSSSCVAEVDLDWVEISPDQRLVKTVRDVSNQRESRTEHIEVPLLPPTSEPSPPVPPSAPHFGMSLPLLSIHAADDPIIHVDTMPCRADVITAVDNLVCLVTSVGGHVGWPVGWGPWNHCWKFQNTLILEFCTSIADSTQTDSGS